MKNKQRNVENGHFYGFKPKHVSENELHIYVLNLTTSLMQHGMNNKTKPMFVDHLEKMYKDTTDDINKEVIQATINLLREEIANNL